MTLVIELTDEEIIKGRLRMLYYSLHVPLKEPDIKYSLEESIRYAERVKDIWQKLNQVK